MIIVNLLIYQSVSYFCLSLSMVLNYKLLKRLIPVACFVFTTCIYMAINRLNTHEYQSTQTQPNYRNRKLESVSANQLSPHVLVFTSNVKLQILITSSPEHFSHRATIRQTWGKETAPHQWRKVFLIGQSENRTLHNMVLKESQEFGDVLLGSYLDSYRNLTHKVLHGFKWTVETCTANCQLQYVMKTDDDCFVNANLLTHFLMNHNTMKKELYVGHVFSEPERLTPIRNPDSKWYVSYDSYKHDLYPEYASGTGYLVSMDVIPRVLEMSKYWKPFPVEDAYIGNLMYVLGINSVHSNRFTLYSNYWKPCNFLYLIVVHHITQQQQYEMKRWTEEAKNKCQNMEEITDWS